MKDQQKAAQAGLPLPPSKSRNTRKPKPEAAANDGATTPPPLPSAISLGELQDTQYARREPLLGSWLTERSYNMVHAPAGVGKSMLTMAMSLAVAGGGSLLGWDAPTPSPVLLVDAELDPSDLKDRSLTLMDTIDGIDREAARRNLTVISRQGQKDGSSFPVINDEGGIEAILKLAAEHRPKLIVLDNLSMLAHIEDENNQAHFDDLIDLVQELKRRGVAVLLVHHNAKGNGNSADSFRGSSKLDAPLDIRIGLARTTVPNPQGGTAFDLQFFKTRGRADEASDEYTTHLVEKDGRMQWVKVNPVANGDQAMYLEAIRSCEYDSGRALGKALGWADYKVSRTKDSCITAGMITQEEVAACIEEAKERAGEDF